MTDYIIFKNLEGKYVTLPEYLEAAKEKHENKVYYVTDEKEQSQYINMFKENELDAIILTHNIDTPFITHLESKNQDVKFMRIDSDIEANAVEADALTEDEAKELTEKLTESFKKALGVENITIKVKALKDENISSMMTQSEETRRMQDMMEMYSMGGAGFDPSMFGGEGLELVLNSKNNLVKYILDNPESENTATICCQLYDLAYLANRPLKPEAMTKFIKRSNEILGILAK